MINVSLCEDGVRQWWGWDVWGGNARWRCELSTPPGSAGTRGLTTGGALGQSCVWSQPVVPVFRVCSFNQRVGALTSLMGSAWEGAGRSFIVHKAERSAASKQIPCAVERSNDIIVEWRGKLREVTPWNTSVSVWISFTSGACIAEPNLKCFYWKCIAMETDYHMCGIINPATWRWSGQLHCSCSRQNANASLHRLMIQN